MSGKTANFIFKPEYKRKLLVVAIVIAAFITGALWRGGKPDQTHDHDQADSHIADTSTQTQMYTCSMHPQVRSPDPDDKCPICGMALIPVPSDEEDGADDGDTPRLRLSPRAVALMDIRTWPVERRPIDMELNLYGKIGFDESMLSDIVARSEVYVEKLFVNTPWQQVAEGELLAEFYSPAVATAMRELLVAGDRLQKNEKLNTNDGATRNAMLEATRARLVRRGVSMAQIEHVLESGEIPRTFRVESPISGVAQPVTVREGEWLREGDRLTRIADLSQVWVNLEAYERDLSWLTEGLPVEFNVAAYPGETFKGEIGFIDPVVNESTRTVRLRVATENPAGRLKPGMLVSASVRAPYDSDARRQTPDAHQMEKSKIKNQKSNIPLIIPVTAPLITGRRALVYVRVPDADRPTFEPRQVVLGPRAKDHYVLLEGLEEGDIVVVNGQFKIDSELQIRGMPSMMTPDGGAPAAHDHGHADHVEGEHTADTPLLQTECPVMGGAVNPDLFVDVDGYRLYVCCPGCDKAILDDPQKYIEELKAKGITPYKIQTHCPIMDLPINKELYHDHEGQRIYVCCPGCLEEVKERASEIIEEHRQRGIVFETHEH